MRKSLVLVVAFALVGALAAVAYAQQAERVNNYTVDATVSPSKRGTVKKPVNVGVEFSFTNREATGKRPSPIEKYSIRFDGLRTNSQRWPGCTAAEINAAEGVSGCKPGSLIGQGTILAKAGGESDQNNQSINCPLNLQVYNSGRNKGALYIAGGAQAPPGFVTDCPTTTNAAIDASFVRRGRAVALEFTVPLVPFRQQLGTVEVAVVDVNSTISRRTRRIGGKKRSFFQAIGGCTGARRNIQVSFTNEDGNSGTARDQVRCTR